MSFKRTITTALTPAQLVRNAVGFASWYSAAQVEQATLTNMTKPQPKMSAEAGPPDDRARMDALFGFSQGSGYSAITSGLAYLEEVNRASKGVRTSALVKFGGAGAPTVTDLSPAAGAAFVKEALSFGVIDQTGEPVLQAQADQYAKSVFTALQAGTFAANDFVQGGKAIAQSTYTYVGSSSYPNSSRGTIAAASNTFRQQRLSLMFDTPVTDVLQSSVYGTGGMAQGRLSRMPEVKLKFLFYCEIEFWYEAANSIGVGTSRTTLASIHQCSSPTATFNQEDVNFYGLNSKVNKSTTYTPVTLQLHDDVNNQSASLMTTLLSASTGSFGDGAERAQDELQDIAGQASASARNTRQPSTHALANRNGIIRSIRTTQVYVIANQCYRDVTTFINPKLSSLSRSELDMSDGSQASGVTIEFSFDAMNIELGLPESIEWREEVDSRATLISGTSGALGGELISGPDTGIAPSTIDFGIPTIGPPNTGIV
jgi:hypothetical protein